MKGIKKNQISTQIWARNSSAFGNSYLFTGRRLDDKTGTYYYRNRYYEASSGQFLSRDPIGYVYALNMYNYVSNQPTVFTDPMGLKPVKEMCPKDWYFVTGPSNNQSIKDARLGRESNFWYAHWNRRGQIDFEWREVSAIRPRVACGADGTLDASITWEESSQHTVGVGAIVNVAKEAVEITGYYEYSWGSSKGGSVTSSISVKSDPGWEYMGIPVMHAAIVQEKSGKEQVIELFGGPPYIRWRPYTRSRPKVYPPLFFELSLVVCKRWCYPIKCGVYVGEEEDN